MIWIGRIVQALASLAVLAGGAGVAFYLVSTKPEAGRAEIEEAAVPVETIEAERVDRVLKVEGEGTVTAARQISLQPQVSGLIEYLNPQFEPGGFLKEGELMLRIDRRDYEFAVERAKERIGQARLQLKQEQSRRAIALREWDLLGREVETTEPGRELALREPHIESAKASLAAAESALEEAKLNLSRTEIRAPFNCWVQRESADIGQMAGPQSVLATLVGTDEYWVRVSTPARWLPFVRIPGLNADEGSPVRIVYDAGTFEMTREGRVLRLLNDQTEGGRMLRLLIEVKDPLGLNEGRPTYPLLLGSFVRAEMEGVSVEGVFAVPRQALREGNRVWIRGEDGRLEIRGVEVLAGYPDEVLVREGLGDGEEIVTSLISAPLPGMRLTATDADTGRLARGEDGGALPEPAAAD